MSLFKELTRISEHVPSVDRISGRASLFICRALTVSLLRKLRESLFGGRALTASSLGVIAEGNSLQLQSANLFA